MPEVILEVEEQVFAQAGISVEAVAEPPSEEELQQFRAFLDDVTPEDFIQEP